MIEPAVEPAEPPTNISASSTSSVTVGQTAKSAFTIPVVVMIETAWKNPVRIDSSPSATPCPQSIAARAIEASATSPTYSRSSSSRTTRPGCLRTNARYMRR